MTREAGVLPVARIQAGVGRGFGSARKAQQRPEGVERVVSPVKAEGELVQVGLQVLRANAVMRSVQPRLQVREDHVDDRQVVVRDLTVTVLRNGQVLETALGQAAVAVEAIRHDHAPRHDGVFHEATERGGGAIRHHRQAHPACDPAALAGVQFSPRFALTHLNGAGDKGLIVDTATLALRPAADPDFIDLDVIVGATDPVSVRADHASAQLVQDLEGRLVAGQAELPLKLDGGHTRRQAGDQIGRPEPYAQRRVRPLHDRARRQARILTAFAATQDRRTGLEPEGFTGMAAAGADEAVAPARGLQIRGAGRFIRKQLLELRERAREGKVFHDQHTSTGICGCKPDRHGTKSHLA